MDRSFGFLKKFHEFAAGETTITASWDAVADKYNAGSKTFAVTVVPAKERLVFEKVTNANQLLAGNEYLLVNVEKGKANGSFSSEKLQELVGKLSPMLNKNQRQKLEEISKAISDK